MKSLSFLQKKLDKINFKRFLLKKNTAKLVNFIY